MNITGLDQTVIAQIPVGATLTKVAYVVPNLYGIAKTGEHDTYESALRSGIADVEFYLAEVATPGSTYLGSFTVDTRWTITSDKGEVDFVASRTIYDRLSEAQAHLDRIERYAPKAV